MTNDTYYFPKHQHSFWEIAYYTHGSGVNTIGDKEFSIYPGQIICQPPGVPHSEYAEKGYRNIYFTVGTFESSENIVPVFADNESKQVYNILMQLYTEAHLQRKNWKNITESLLNTAYHYMISFSYEKAKNPYVEKIENLLISNISKQNLCYHEIMSEIPLSIDHCRRLFIKETGKTPSEYLTEKRINYAKLLIETRLRNNSISVKEIANHVGFDDPYYFSRVFKKVTGKSPTKW
jgi:AraC-like DNA-binding protein